MTTAPPPLGWPLLPVPDADGCLQWGSLADSVRQTVQVILATRPGEQLMHSEFGAGLADFLHEPNTLTTRRRLRDAVTAALTRFEPRILLDRVDVREVPGRASELRVEVAYRLRRTGAPAQLGATVTFVGP